MIQVSDNEAFNELVRIQNERTIFFRGCVDLNDWLEEEGYGIPVSIIRWNLRQTEERISEGGKNHASARTAGGFWKLFIRGEAVGDNIQDMLIFLLGQEQDYKIPAEYRNM